MHPRDKGIHWTCKKIRYYQNTLTDNHNVRPWLKDTKIRLMTIFNTITSRPILHIGKALLHK
jgi:hypothetical protein